MGFDWGMYNYVIVFVFGNGVDENCIDVFDWFCCVVVFGYVKLINLIGGFYEDGWVVVVDIDVVFDYYCCVVVVGDFCG